MGAALRVEQLIKVVQQIKEYGYGAQLQDIALTESHLLLQHYLKGEFTLGIELKPLTPRMGYFFGEIPKRKYLVKPIVLFLRAHARNLRLMDIFVDIEKGRIVKLIYGGGEQRQCEIELRLIPHGVNVIISAQQKSISLFPVKILPPSLKQEGTSEVDFNLETYLDDWCQGFANRKGVASEKGVGVLGGVDLEKKKLKEIQKREILISKLEKDLLSLNKPWKEVGEYLKSCHELSLPEDWMPLVDPSLSVSANMQLSFDKHKSQEKRKEQILERIQYLRTEVQELQSSSLLGLEGKEVSRPVHSSASELLNKAKAKGRKKILSEGIEAVFGKSAKDNLALLRKAQPWDLWLHLRDRPGSHLFIRRPRNKTVDHSLLLTAAQWFLKETLGKSKLIEGDRYDVIVTECRFVKPIRGDRIGRVTFQNEMNLSLRI